MKILNISAWICRNGRDFCWNVKNYKAKSTHRRWNRVIVRIFDIHNQALAQFKQSFISKKKTSGNVHMLWLMQNTHKIPTIWSVFRFVSDFFAPRSIIWHQSLMHNDLNYNLPLHLNRLDSFFLFWPYIRRFLSLEELAACELFASEWKRFMYISIAWKMQKFPYTRRLSGSNKECTSLAQPNSTRKKSGDTIRMIAIP